MANDGSVRIGTELDNSGFKEGLAKLGSVAKSGLSATGTAIKAIAGTAAAAAGSLLALESATEEYRIAQGKLNTAFEAAGYSAETAQEAYQGFYQILGETDTATEASQLLAKLAQNQEDVSEWTRIAAGVNGTFGDSLPIEGLIESANETQRVGQVTGVLADALNWVGISEDEFNEKLEACSTTSERNQLIMETLSSTYSQAADAFYKNNEALIEARNSQMMLDEALAKLGETVSNVKNNLTAEFLPSISQIVTAFTDMVNGVDGADAAFSEAISGIIAKLVEKLPEFLSFGVEIIKAIVQGIAENAEQIAEGAITIIENLAQAIVELAPSLAEGALELIKALAQGLIERIPDFIAALPQIIVSIAQFFTDNAPEMRQIGLQILLAILEGIIKAIPELIKAIPQLIEAINQAFIDLGEDIGKIGIAIVEGIWEGIKEGAQWLYDKVTDFAQGIVDTVKDALGIHSPSKEAEWMGEMWDKGLVNGIMKGRSSVEKALDFSANLSAWMPQIQSAMSGFARGFAPAYATAGAPQTTHTITEINRNTTQTVRVIPDQRGIFKLVKSEETRRGKSLIKGEGFN
ncbi:hypothetical protein [uncultured Agathobaculum sp.]|uniref:phage tail protein n=1 Tax=uncultured Agathobaculum sp. TaxID=2048140 RepID=UPI003207DE39